MNQNQAELGSAGEKLLNKKRRHSIYILAGGSGRMKMMSLKYEDIAPG